MRYQTLRKSINNWSITYLSIWWCFA